MYVTNQTNYNLLEERRKLVAQEFEEKKCTYPYNAIVAAGIKGIISNDQVKAFEAIMTSIEKEYQNAIIARYMQNSRVSNALLTAALTALTRGNYKDMLTLGISFFPNTRSICIRG